MITIYLKNPFYSGVGEEVNAVVNVLKTSTQMGPNVHEFEAKVAALFDKKFGVMVNSGSSANYLAIEILDLPPGAEVITPVLTFSTTVAPLVQNNLIPVFVDVEEGTYNINVSKIEEMVESNTKALMIPSLLGNFSDYDSIKALCDKFDLILIEDSADTLGSRLRNERTGKRSARTGKRSAISTTSFYGSHIINCAGNGGMLCMNDNDLFEKSLLLRSWGRSSSIVKDSENAENRFNVEVSGISYDSKFMFQELGYNFEPSELGAAFGLVQLTKLEENIDKRVFNFRALKEFFKDYEDWFILPNQIDDSRTGWLAFPLTIRAEAPFSRREMQTFMENKNIQTRVIFTGNILRQPAFEHIKYRSNPEGYDNADQVMRGGILLACHHGLTEAQLNHIRESFSEFSNKQ